jgi:pimeloyl-ACP methyl ester carboxylesterase
MARWVSSWLDTDLALDCSRVKAPALVVTGEPQLDRIVPVESTLEYLSLLPHSRHAVLDRTGHLGTLLHPIEFAAVVAGFVSDRADGSGIPAGALLPMENRRH